MAEFKLPAKKNYTVVVNGQRLNVVLSVPREIPTQELLDEFVATEFRDVMIVACRKQFGPGRILPLPKVDGKPSEYIWAQVTALPEVTWK